MLWPCFPVIRPLVYEGHADKDQLSQRKRSFMFTLSVYKIYGKFFAIFYRKETFPEKVLVFFYLDMEVMIFLAKN